MQSWIRSRGFCYFLLPVGCILQLCTRVKQLSTSELVHFWISGQAHFGLDRWKAWLKVIEECNGKRENGREKLSLRLSQQSLTHSRCKVKKKYPSKCCNSFKLSTVYRIHTIISYFVHCITPLNKVEKQMSETLATALEMQFSFWLLITNCKSLFSRFYIFPANLRQAFAGILFNAKIYLHVEMLVYTILPILQIFYVLNFLSFCPYLDNSRVFWV